MTKQKCTNCERLQKELRETKKELKQAKKLLERIAAQCDDTAKSTADEMTRGNIPQGAYAFLNGKNNIANTILYLMSLKSHHRQKTSKLFKGLLKWI